MSGIKEFSSRYLMVFDVFASVDVISMGFSVRWLLSLILKSFLAFNNEILRQPLNIKPLNQFFLTGGQQKLHEQLKSCFL